jgi:ATP-dependent DNA helicase RecG
MDGADLHQSVYEVVGVGDPDRLQQELACRCRTDFNIPVRPEIQTELLEGKPVIMVTVPEAERHIKPVFIRSKGISQGAFRRIGSTDQRCTEEDLAFIHQLRDRRSFDQRVIADASIEDFDPYAIEEYRRLRARIQPNAAELDYIDRELLESICAVSVDEGLLQPTLAGLLLFGKRDSLRRCLPLCRVDYIIVPGKDWVSEPEKRFQSIELREPLLTLIPKIVALVLGDLPRSFSWAAGGVQSMEQTTIPELVLREALVNAVMHRTYRLAQPVQVIRYSNRLEIRNPGFSLKPVERLGEPGSLVRNEKLAAVLHELDFAETKGSGIRAMREAMQKANLSVPIFNSNREDDQFEVTLFAHHLMDGADLEWLSNFADCELSDDDARILLVLRDYEVMSNSLYRWIADVDTLTASRRLQKLRDQQLVEQRGKGSSTVYLPGLRLKQAGAATPQEFLKPAGLTPQEHSQAYQGELQQELEFDPGSQEIDASTVPVQVAKDALALGRKAPQAAVDEAIIGLCSIEPRRPADLARILGRSQRWITEGYLRRLVRHGELFMTYPDNRSHPDQRYSSSPRGARLS